MKLVHRDINQFVKFGLVGVLNTALHALVVIVAHGSFFFAVIGSHIFAFMVANLFSYFLNSFLVFRRPPTYASYIRFLSVSLFSLIVTVTTAAICEVAGLDYRVGLVLVILVAPPMTYLLQKRVTFRLR